MVKIGTPEGTNVQGNENILEDHSEQMKGMNPEQKMFVQNLLKENHKHSQENMILKKEKSDFQSASHKTESKEPIDNESKAKESSKRKIFWLWINWQSMFKQESQVGKDLREGFSEDQRYDS